MKLFISCSFSSTVCLFLYSLTNIGKEFIKSFIQDSSIKVNDGKKVFLSIK